MIGTVLILGCGRLGLAVGTALTAAGSTVIGLRRGAGTEAPFPVRSGDLAEAATLAALPEADAILLCATPGLRRGRDHGLLAGMQALARLQPRARLVYTGSTAVYADANGARVDEGGALASGDPAVDGLLAIEGAVLARPHGLVLRCPALVGPGRGETRVRTGLVQVTGDPQRRCSFIHADDLATVCVEALAGRLGAGVLNVAHPETVTLEALHLATAKRLGVACRVVGDGQKVRSLGINTGRAQRLLPEMTWTVP